jgi:MFS family permease
VAPSDEVTAFRLFPVIRAPAFITISLPFALALTAQVGFLTHQLAVLSPSIGTVAAGWAIGLTTFAAVAGRVAAGFIADRLDRRVVAACNFAVQAVGIAVLAAATARPLFFLGCVLFGVGVGNATTLPGLIVQQEFPKPHFARIVSLVVAIDQFSFAFGPSLLATLEGAADSYTAPFLVCAASEVAAAIVVLMPVVTGCRKTQLSKRHRHSAKDVDGRVKPTAVRFRCQLHWRAS